MIHQEPEAEDPRDPQIQKRIRTKYNLIRELVQTEKTFMSDMKVLVNIYWARLLNSPFCDYVSERDKSALFTNLDQLVILSRTFVSHLLECVPAYILTECELTPLLNDNGKHLEDVESHIGEVILEYIPNMEMTYKVYCAQSQFQLNTFYRLNTQGSPMVDRWLQECRTLSEDKTQAWTLDALLIKPVQRLLKYPLLLASMLEVTPENHPDHYQLKRALDKMQKTANRINDIEPEVIYSYPSMPSDSTTPGNNQAIDYNTSMMQLKNDAQCDEELEMLFTQFDRKQRHVKNLTKYLQAEILQIQKHFNANSSLAHAWSSWSSLSEDPNNNMAHSARIKVYQRFAMFSLPFTTSSSAHVSTNKLYKRVEDEVIQPLLEMWAGYYNVANSIGLREKYHLYYQKYVEWKASYAASTEEESQLDATTLEYADLFLRLHNMLKTELPALFSFTEELIDSCLVRYLAIQRDWFRVAVDSTSNVFGLTLVDIRPTSIDSDPIVSAFNRSQASQARQTVDDELAICQFRRLSNNRYSMNSVDFQFQRGSTNSFHGSTSSLSSSGESTYQTSNNGGSTDELHYTTTTMSQRSGSPMDDKTASHLLSPSISKASTVLQPTQHFYPHHPNKQSVASTSTFLSAASTSTSTLGGGSSIALQQQNLRPTMSNASSVMSAGSGHSVRRRSSLMVLPGWTKRSGNNTRSRHEKNGASGGGGGGGPAGSGNGNSQPPLLPSSNNSRVKSHHATRPSLPARLGVMNEG